MEGTTRVTVLASIARAKARGKQKHVTEWGGGGGRDRRAVKLPRGGSHRPPYFVRCISTPYSLSFYLSHPFPLIRLYSSSTAISFQAHDDVPLLEPRTKVQEIFHSLRCQDSSSIEEQTFVAELQQCD